MPKPENIRRIVTGPKSENRSIRKSRSIMECQLYDVILRCELDGAPAPFGEPRRMIEGIVAILRDAAQERGSSGCRQRSGEKTLDLRGRKLHRFAAAAGAGLVRVVEDEL